MHLEKDIHFNFMLPSAVPFVNKHTLKSDFEVNVGIGIGYDLIYISINSL